MSFDRVRAIPRQRQPEVEHDLSRSTALGYETAGDAGWIRCHAHGYPSTLARWHCHDEYEIHLITETSGRAFIGNWIGPFKPGHLVLCGPRLPHNWISLDMPEAGVVARDLIIQFRQEPLAPATVQLPELAEVAHLLERARHGIEFFGISAQAQDHWTRIKGAHGLRRLGAFCDLMADLSACNDYRLLSSVQIKGAASDSEGDRINALVTRITDHIAEPLALADLAVELGMSESRFSRYFKRSTGNNFTDFVNLVRINNACHLLMHSDEFITDICYQVGFNNVANFNRRFLEVKGMTPREFRRQADTRFGGSR